jgi:hypothetical protein
MPEGLHESWRRHGPFWRGRWRSNQTRGTQLSGMLVILRLNLSLSAAEGLMVPGGLEAWDVAALPVTKLK